MRTASRSLDRAGAPPPEPASRFGARHALASLLAACGAASGLIALRLEAVVGSYDSLAYLLQVSAADRLALARALVMLAGGWLAVLAVVTLRSARMALALGGAALSLTGCLAFPVARALLAAPRGLEESLIYRLRGLTAAGLLGGAFLIFLSALPAMLAAPPRGWETKLSRRVGFLAGKFAAIPAPWRRIGIGALAFLAVVAVGIGILADFPNSSDENSYVTQARIFASGRLWVEAPPHPEFFRARSLVMDQVGGRFFAKAFPGWAALLSLGVRAGAAWIVNPILSALTLVLAAWAGGKMLGERGELGVTGMILVTPFFLFNSASYFNHPAALFCVTLFLAAVLKLEQGGGAPWALLAGAAAGYALALRPVSAVALTFPILAWIAWRWVRVRRWRLLFAAALPLLSSVAMLGLYNRLMFGSAWTTGYEAYDPADIRMRLGPDNLLITGWWLLKLLLWTIPGSLAGLYFLGRGRRPRDWFSEEPLPALMAASLLALGLGYLFLQNKGGNEYGPRYYYDGFTYLALLMTAGWMRAARALEGRFPAPAVRRAVSLALGFGVLLTVVGSNPLLMTHYRDKVAHNRDLYASLEKTGLHSALVFLETGSGRMPPGDLVRNPLDFRTGVIYARDLGIEADRRLAALYPDRPALVYAYDPFERRSTLRRLEPGRPR